MSLSQPSRTIVVEPAREATEAPPPAPPAPAPAPPAPAPQTPARS